MRVLAEALSGGIKHVRVDLYDTEAGVKIRRNDILSTRAGLPTIISAKATALWASFTTGEEQA
jgi:hypothetical protein